MAPPSPTGRSTRARPAKAPLGLEVIVDAGLRVLQREGLDAVTMRRVATELDTGAASLYVYVDNRDALVMAMLDRVVGTIELPRVDGRRWRRQLDDLLRGMLAAFEAHPGMARVAVANIPTGENALRASETLLSLLMAGGIHEQAAAWATDLLALVVTATAVEGEIYASRAEGATEEEFIAQLRAMFASLPADRYPHVSALAGPLTTGSGDVRFDFALEVIVDGLLAWRPSKR